MPRPRSSATMVSLAKSPHILAQWKPKGTGLSICTSSCGYMGRCHPWRWKAPCGLSVSMPKSRTTLQQTSKPIWMVKMQWWSIIWLVLKMCHIPGHTTLKIQNMSKTPILLSYNSQGLYNIISVAKMHVWLWKTTDFNANTGVLLKFRPGILLTLMATGVQSTLMGLLTTGAQPWCTAFMPTMISSLSPMDWRPGIFLFTFLCMLQRGKQIHPILQHYWPKNLLFTKNGNDITRTFQGLTNGFCSVVPTHWQGSKNFLLQKSLFIWLDGVTDIFPIFLLWYIGHQ